MTPRRLAQAAAKDYGKFADAILDLPDGEQMALAKALETQPPKSPAAR
jgi:hypothetical protein